MCFELGSKEGDSPRPLASCINYPTLHEPNMPRGRGFPVALCFVSFPPPLANRAVNGKPACAQLAK